MSYSTYQWDPEQTFGRNQAAGETQIAVCIPTYKRPGGLCRLLEALALQEPLLNCQITIVVVDNENSPETKAICDERASKMPYPIVYCSEPRRGYSYVRNKAVEVAREFADAIAFIDDDEVPSPGWLKYLAACQRAYGADAVSGPVAPYFVSRVPQWIRKGRFFDRPRYVTGTMLPGARTGNVLIRMEAFDRIGVFDDRFAFTGGEDEDFFARLHASGGVITWSDEALVEEWRPPSHTTLRYVLRMAYWKAEGSAIRGSRSYAASLLHVVGGVLGGIKGLYSLVTSVTRGKVEAVKALQRIWGGAGTVAGAIGRRNDPYRTTPSAGSRDKSKLIDGTSSSPVPSALRAPVQRRASSTISYT